LAAWRRAGISVAVISHKTRHPYRGPHYDLHQAARDWLEWNGFFDPKRIGLAADEVFFELSKSEKLHRIGAARCTHFIDDLPDILAADEFPRGVQRILFDPHQTLADDARWQRYSTWADMERALLHEA